MIDDQGWMMDDGLWIIDDDSIQQTVYYTVDSRKQTIDSRQQALDSKLYTVEKQTSLTVENIKS